MMTTKIPSDFYIYDKKYHFYANQALDWFIKGWKYKYDSYEWKICRLKQKIYGREAMKSLDTALEKLHNGI